MLRTMLQEMTAPVLCISVLAAPQRRRAWWSCSTRAITLRRRRSLTPASVRSCQRRSSRRSGALIGKLGKLKAVGTPKWDQAQGYTVAGMPFTFENQTITTRVVHGAAGSVSGLFCVPAKG